MATGEMFDLNLGDEVPTRGGGSFLDVEGKFHCEIVSLELNPTGKSGSLIPNAFCKVNFNIVGGTNPAGVGKQANFVLFNPALDKSEKSNAWAKKRIFFFLCAIGMHDENRGPKIQLNLATLPNAAIGRQFVCKMVFEVDQNTQQRDKFPSLSFCDLWHVDDPEAADAVNQGMLLEYPPALRRKPESFGKPVKSAAKTGATAPASGSTTTGRPNSTTTGKPPAMPTTPSADPLDDL